MLIKKICFVLNKIRFNQPVISPREISRLIRINSPARILCNRDCTFFTVRRYARCNGQLADTLEKFLFLIRSLGVVTRVTDVCARERSGENRSAIKAVTKCYGEQLRIFHLVVQCIHAHLPLHFATQIHELSADERFRDHHEEMI